ncbi:MAG: hypothetical protein F4X57_08685 [Chloroflexi bacterium]|nr:hypothetical protein [Chloroflexota bacterium]
MNLRTIGLLSRRSSVAIIVFAALATAALLAWLFLPPSYGAFVSISHLDYFKDMSDPSVLVGSADNVFFGEVEEKLGQTTKNGWVETQYRVRVMEVFKGSLSGEVTVNRHGGYDRLTRTIEMVDGAPDMPEAGRRYLFATRLNSVEDWHTFPPGYGDIAVWDDEHADELRRIFTIAVESEVITDP